MVIGTVFAARKFHDFFCARYNVTPPNLHSKCDGFGTSFDVRHILSCIKGSLVIARHNEVRDKLLYLAWRAFNSAAVSAKPLIRQGRNRSEREIRQGSEKIETQGDVMIQG